MNKGYILYFLFYSHSDLRGQSVSPPLSLSLLNFTHTHTHARKPAHAHSHTHSLFFFSFSFTPILFFSAEDGGSSAKQPPTPTTTTQSENIQSPKNSQSQFQHQGKTKKDDQQIYMRECTVKRGRQRYLVTEVIHKGQVQVSESVVVDVVVVVVVVAVVVVVVYITMLQLLHALLTSFIPSTISQGAYIPRICSEKLGQRLDNIKSTGELSLRFHENGLIIQIKMTMEK